MIVYVWDTLWKALRLEAYGSLTPLQYTFWLMATSCGVDTQDMVERGRKLLEAHKARRFVGLKPYLGYHPSEWGW